MSRQCKHPTCGATCRRKTEAPAITRTTPTARTPIKRDRTYKIPKTSEKRDILQEVYDILAKDFREDNPLCKINSPVCTTYTQCVNHIRGKVGIMLIRVRWFEPSCFACNTYIEQFHAWAAANGHRLPDYLPEDQRSYTKELTLPSIAEHITKINQPTNN